MMLQQYSKFWIQIQNVFSPKNDSLQHPLKLIEVDEQNNAHKRHNDYILE